METFIDSFLNKSFEFCQSVKPLFGLVSCCVLFVCARVGFTYIGFVKSPLNLLLSSPSMLLCCFDARFLYLRKRGDVPSIMCMGESSAELLLLLRLLFWDFSRSMLSWLFFSALSSTVGSCFFIAIQNGD